MDPAPSGTLRLSRCTECEYDLRGLEDRGRDTNAGVCPECGFEFGDATFDVRVKRVRQGALPWGAIAQFVVFGGLLVLFPGSHFAWMIVGAAIAANVVVGYFRAKRQARGLDIPRLVCTHDRIALLRGISQRGSWPLRMFTKAQLHLRNPDRPDLWLFDDLGLAFAARMICTRAEADAVLAEVTRRIDNARAWAEVGVR